MIRILLNVQVWLQCPCLEVHSYKYGRTVELEVHSKAQCQVTWYSHRINRSTLTVSVLSRPHPHAHTPTHLQTYVQIWIYMSNCILGPGRDPPGMQRCNGTKPMSTAISTINQAINLRSPTHFLIPIRLSCILLIYDHALVHLHRKTEKCSMQRRVVGETVVFFFHDKSHSSLSHFPSQRAPSNRRMLTSWWHPAWVMLCMNGAEPR